MISADVGGSEGWKGRGGKPGGGMSMSDVPGVGSPMSWIGKVWGMWMGSSGSIVYSSGTIVVFRLVAFVGDSGEGGDVRPPCIDGRYILRSIGRGLEN